MPGPIASREEHDRAVRALVERLRANPETAAFAAEIERIVRFELEGSMPAADRLAARLSPARSRARRTALISDIHGSYEGLLKVLADAEAQGCDRIVCLGDLVDGGPANDEVVETLRRLGVPCVRGNHDEYNDLALDAGNRDFLSSLPESIVEEGILFTHISPRRCKRKVNHVVEAWNVFDEFDYRCVFIGHVHIPYVFGKRSGTHGEARQHAFEYNKPFALDADDMYVVSVGSVGYGRDDIGRPRYAIYDAPAQTVELRLVDGPVLPLDYSVRWRSA
jgi:predicted phosphodiesterase